MALSRRALLKASALAAGVVLGGPEVVWSYPKHRGHGNTGNAFDQGMTYTSVVTVPTGIGWTDGTDARSNIHSMYTAHGGGSDATHHVKYVWAAGAEYDTSAYIDMTLASHVTNEFSGSQGSSYTDALGASVGQTGGAEVHGTWTDWSTSNIQGIFGSASGEASPANDWRFHGGRLSGGEGFSNFATTTAGEGGEDQFGLMLYGATDILLDHMEIMEVKGDLIYANGASGSTSGQSGNITMQYSVGRRNGRQGFGIIHCDTIKVTHCALEDIAEGVFDFEPNVSGQNLNDMEFSYNHLTGKWSWEQNFDDAVIVIAGDVGATITGYFKVLNNLVDAQSAAVSDQFTGFGHLWNANGNQTKAALLTISGNQSSISVGATHVVTLEGWTNGATITSNTGFAPAGARSWVSDDGNNGTITQSGNT